MVGHADDPWLLNSQTGSSPSSDSQKFEDNFVQPAPFEPLPDSDEYLAGLERKLRKLQTGKGRDKDLLKSLQQRRETAIDRLLNSADPDQQEEFDDQAVDPNPILRKLAPESQAITAIETVILVKADALAQRHEEEVEEDPETKEESDQHHG